jgi:FHS family L-fucose permease-like MFS transporter
LWLYLAITGLFVICGVGFWNNILLFPRLAQFFGIDFFHARWIQALYSLGYLVMALPSAYFHRKYGYKIGMMFALGLVSVGPFLIYPALTHNGIAYFLAAVVLMGAGWSMLETSINPLAIEIGRPETAVRRLNFVQSFFPVGVVLGYAVGRWGYPSDMTLSFNALAETAARPYVIVGVAVLLLTFLIERVEFPAQSGKRSGGVPQAHFELRGLLANPTITIGMAAIFCCIALQSTLQGATYQYVQQQYPGYTDALAQNIVFAGLIIFGIGRFAGTALMGWITPNRLLLGSIGACVALTLGSWALGGVAGLVCLIATNLCVAIVYPTVFATTVRDLRSEANIASGLLVTASALAGLVIPLAMNYLIEATNARVAILMALPCFPVLYLYVRHTLNRPLSNEPVAVLQT